MEQEKYHRCRAGEEPSPEASTTLERDDEHVVRSSKNDATGKDVSETSHRDMASASTTCAAPRAVETVVAMVVAACARATAVVEAWVTLAASNAFVTGALTFWVVSYARRVATSTVAVLARSIDRACYATFVVANEAPTREEYADVRALVARDDDGVAGRVRYDYGARRRDRGDDASRSARGVKIEPMVEDVEVRRVVGGATVSVVARSGNGRGERRGAESWFDAFARRSEEERGARFEGEEGPRTVTIRIWRLFRSNRAVKLIAFELLKEGAEARRRALAKVYRDFTIVRVPKSVAEYAGGERTSTSRSFNQSWVSSERPTRALETVILPSLTRDRIEEDVKEFLETEQWYVDRGLPWKRGYLLHGVPGTGKTSLVYALAGRFKLPLYCVRLNDPFLDDEGLFRLFQSTEKRSIILLEDVDAPGSNPVFLKRAATDRAENNRSERTNSLTVSSTLSLLDGVYSCEGRLIFLTCRDKNALNQTIIRPGRFDFVLRFDLPKAEQIETYFSYFYSTDGGGDEKSLSRMAIEFAKLSTSDDRAPSSMADIQGVLLSHKKSPRDALNAMRDRVASQKSHETQPARTRAETAAARATKDEIIEPTF